MLQCINLLRNPNSLFNESYLYITSYSAASTMAVTSKSFKAHSLFVQRNILIKRESSVKYLGIEGMFSGWCGFFLSSCMVASLSRG